MDKAYPEPFAPRRAAAVRLWTTAVALAALTGTAPAWADAVFIDEDACPEGTFASGSHAGTICDYQGCSSPCPEGTVCRAQGFCYTQVTGVSMNGPVVMTTISRHCDPAAGGCDDCRVYDSCLPPLDGENNPPQGSAGAANTTASGGAPTTPAEAGASTAGSSDGAGAPVGDGAGLRAVESPSGCGCRATSGSPSSRYFLSLCGLAALVALRRRSASRRHAW